MHVVDIYTDLNQETLVKIAQDTPALASRLSLMDEINLDDKDSLSDQAFAWPEERMYPVYTKEAALLSSVYLEEADVPQHVIDNCVDACSAFDVAIEIGSIEKVASEDSLNPSDFVLPGRQKLPVVDEETYATSEDIFINNLHDFSLSEKVVGARQLVKKASEMNIAHRDELTQLSLNGQLNVERAQQLSMDRYSATADDQYLFVGEKLAGQRYSGIEKIAEWIVDMSALDEENGIDDSNALFGAMDSMEKVAALMIDEEEIPLEKIAQIDEGEWSDILDRETVGFLFENGTLEYEKLASMLSECSDMEYDVLSSFIQNKTRN